MGKWYNRKPMNEIIVWTLVLIVLIAYGTGLNYVQRYTLNIDGTATKGIIFKKTIVLSEYKKLGSGNGIFGNYDIYSRSDRRNAVLSIYK